MQTIRVNLGPRSYDIAVGARAEAHFPQFVRERLPQATRLFVITDANVHVHADRLATRLGAPTPIVVPAGESSKSLGIASELYSHLARVAADRQSAIIAVGGGVVGDLAGFVAATFNRGMALMAVPTSLLAMVDSAVGGKVGINLPEGKNLVGAFHQPAGVWIDTAVLDTLPDREYRSGLAEVVKYGVILDAAFFDWIEAHADAILQRTSEVVLHLVAQCCTLKAHVVEHDEREETGRRMVLNYGHTFAHAFESVAGYGQWLHGEAVAAGMICASRLAELRGLVGPDVTQRQVGLLRHFGLPTTPDVAWDIEALLDVMRRDKKNVSGRMRFVLPTRIGHVEPHDDVPESLVREVLTQR